MVRFSDIIRLRDKKEADKIQPAAPLKHEEGFRLSDSSFFSLLTTAPPVIKEASFQKNKRAEAERYYMALMERSRETSDLIKNNRTLSPAPLISDLHVILEKGLINSLYEYALAQKKDAYDLASHTADVTVIALKMGKAMNYDMRMMLRLGLTAMLENAGMYMISEKILNSPERLSSAEMAIVRKHPETGYEILLSLGKRYNWLAETARFTHERADGSGYPFGVRGENIPEPASVIAVADTFCAMIEKRPYRNNFLPHEAARHIAESGRTMFPAKPLRAFLYEVSLFPVRSYVKLNNGFTGRVIRVNRRQPLSPVIEILYDKEGRKIEDGPQIDLSLNPLLHIEKCMAPDIAGAKEAN
ncbi:MAG: HD domain-containing protein [Deltaproteobacteria bacterium]|nr:HD domain-containing protein [Deltaproteobacteria bacterium]